MHSTLSFRLPFLCCETNQGSAVDNVAHRTPLKTRVLGNELARRDYRALWPTYGSLAESGKYHESHFN